MKVGYLLSVFILLWGLLAGCGGGPQRVTIRTDGLGFEKPEVRVRAGESITLRVVNRDGYAHSAVIYRIPARRRYRAGTTKKSTSVQVTIPLRMTMAVGRNISRPGMSPISISGK